MKRPMRVPKSHGTVDGRLPANQLRLVVYPVIYRGLGYIPGGCLGFLNHQQYQHSWKAVHIQQSHSCLEYP